MNEDGAEASSNPAAGNFEDNHQAYEPATNKLLDEQRQRLSELENTNKRALEKQAQLEQENAALRVENKEVKEANLKHVQDTDFIKASILAIRKIARELREFVVYATTEETIQLNEYPTKSLDAYLAGTSRQVRRYTADLISKTDDLRIRYGIEGADILSGDQKFTAEDFKKHNRDKFLQGKYIKFRKRPASEEELVKEETKKAKKAASLLPHAELPDDTPPEKRARPRAGKHAEDDLQWTELSEDQQKMVSERVAKQLLADDNNPEVIYKTWAPKVRIAIHEEWDAEPRTVGKIIRKMDPFIIDEEAGTGLYEKHILPDDDDAETYFKKADLDKQIEFLEARYKGNQKALEARKDVLLLALIDAEEDDKKFNGCVKEIPEKYFEKHLP